MNKHLKYYSQSGQDCYVNEIVFKQRKEGFFLDIGANDGITYSNTYFFEKELNWSGICIEPHPSVFEKLSNNRKSILLNKCISDQIGQVDFLRIDGYAEMLSGVYMKYDQRHMERIKKELKEFGGNSEIITVESLTISKLLSEYSIRKIDFCSIDTEGGEFEILKQFDLNTIAVQCFSIENNYNDNRVRDYLQEKKYKLINSLDADEIYLKRAKKFYFWW